MNLRTALPACLVWLIAIAAPQVHAQEAGMVKPSAPIEACAAIEIDASRLACYDQAAGHVAATPQQADAAAEAATAANAAASKSVELTSDAGQISPPAAREVLRSLFRRDAPQPDAELDSAIANAGKGSLLDSRWELARDSKLGVFNFRAYKPVYLLPVFWTSSTNTRPFSPNPDNTSITAEAVTAFETKFQISFKTKAVENLFGDNGDIWMAYTQSSHWQVYNSDASRPFRETDYEPEVMLAFRTGYGLLGWKGRLLAVGVNHQSNGRSDPLSRSWNRVMFNVGLDRDGWALNLRPWIRIPEGGNDDNPDISDYMGRGDVTLVRALPNGQQLSLLVRSSLRGGDRSHGAFQFDWAFPLHKTFRGHLQIFDGYGESLIDYNHRATYVGLGISLMEWY